MSGGLLTVEGDGYERCTICGAKAVGPCATCKAPVCGNCCVLTEHGVTTYAICLECDGSHGKSLRRGWLGVVWLFLRPSLYLVAALVVLYLFFGTR